MTREWFLIAVLGLGLAFGLTSCEDKEGSNEGAVAGPAVDVHCDGLRPQTGLGDTSVRVQCAP